ncbi:MAG: hypothetical protein ABSF76_18605 [Opitutaceae bacterium]|jgi:hypothetical protein
MARRESAAGFGAAKDGLRDMAPTMSTACASANPRGRRLHCSPEAIPIEAPA